MISYSIELRSIHKAKLIISTTLVENFKWRPFEFSLYFDVYFYIYDPAKMTTQLAGKHDQNPKVLVNIFIANADNGTMQHGNPHFRIMWLVHAISYSQMKESSTNGVILGQSSRRGQYCPSRTGPGRTHSTAIEICIPYMCKS